ncbi:MAG: quinone-dependent dihydroorotate dehydrogenase [Rickettsiales bacterium]
MSLYSLIRPLVFSLPPEQAHRAAIKSLMLGAIPTCAFKDARLNTELAGLNLPNPVGLAAGFDKNAEVYNAALKAGFGYAEIGTVTPKAQAGNPTPRIFRLIEQEAIINRLGFNNEGMEAAAWNLRHRKQGGVVGGNIGKNKDTEDAASDYAAAMRTLYALVDYITVNISSPNTPGLRNLQGAEALQPLVRAVHDVRADLVKAGLPRKPIFVKIAPDNDDAALKDIADVALTLKIDGLIVSNTTISRDGVEMSPHESEQGGLSGKPLFQKSTQVLKHMYQLTEGRVPLIGVGGISSAHDAYAKIRAGASAVQLYTALIYKGFGLVNDINRGLVKLLERDGFTSIKDVIGKDA